MATTLEDFVAKLHSEGVATGRAEAERLIEEARRQGESIRREAEAQAHAIVAEARSEAAEERARTDVELKLAARDALLSLQAALTRCMDAVLRQELRAPLRDPDVMAGLIEHLVAAYARSDAAGDRHIEVHVPEDLLEQVRDRVTHKLARFASGDHGLDVRGTLCDAGFEYRVGGGKVDMGLDAVAEQVRALVRPRLAEILASAAGELPADRPDPAPPSRGVR
jgi:vacuolar-type H+-ATPase subunit E/Vma4